MSTQRHEEKRVEEHARTQERERKRMHRGRGWGVGAGRGREGEKERARECFGSSFYMFFPPPGPALCKLGLARSAVCSTWGLHSDPGTFLCSIFAGFSLPCLLATAILNSFSLFYLPNITIYKTLFLRVHFSQTLSLSVPITVIFDPKKPLVSQVYFLFPSQNAISFLIPFLPKHTGGQITQSKLCTD